MIIQVVRDGHIGPYIFGRLTVGDQVYNTAEMVDGSLPVGDYKVTVNEHGRPVIGEDYMICDHRMGRFAPRGLTLGLHMSDKGWDFTDKVTIARHVESEILREIGKKSVVKVRISYRDYPSAKVAKDAKHTD